MQHIGLSLTIDHQVVDGARRGSSRGWAEALATFDLLLAGYSTRWRSDSDNSYAISTDKARLDVAYIHRYLSEESYWAKGRTRTTVETAIANSLCFGLFWGADGGFRPGRHRQCDLRLAV